MTDPSTGRDHADNSQSSATPILTGALRIGGILALGIAVIGSVIGYLLSGETGLVSALIGAAFAAVFMGLTAASILIAGRVAHDEIAVFFGIIFGVWILKLIFFVVASLWLRTQPWLNPGVFGVTMIVAVLGSLVVDVVVFQRSRVPYVDVTLPNPGTHPEQKSRSDS